jgi:hypothetical protein
MGLVRRTCQEAYRRATMLAPVRGLAGVFPEIWKEARVFLDAVATAASLRKDGCTQ